ncbi:MAG: hypothetical protein RMJ43_03620 [Chloroherpetonaceae bacterium]|nr:hypothetical protein [Chthonomonadaceae bacterium]MDW8206901.1 hypothetical protein [Chloroherpetonaceae bacterium]
MHNLDRRELMLGVGGLSWSISANMTVTAAHRERPFAYMMNYVTRDDFPLMKEMNVNTVLVELDKNGRNWRATYEAAIRHDLLIVPLIWGQDQSIWRWNAPAKEWELSDKRYPRSIGARFIRFLLDNPRYRDQTFAIYSFHEPLAQPERTGPSRLKKFYQQIHEEVFKGQDIRVYGEDMTFVWPRGRECLTGVLDYEIHDCYPFANPDRGRYRLFLPQGHYGGATSDLEKVLDLQRQTIELQLKNISNARPAKNGRRPRLILILQAFVDPTEKGLWDRMPDAEEMRTVADYMLDKLGDRLAGIAWYSFRQAATHYTQWLHKDRYDEHHRDRWQVVAEIGKRLRSQSGSAVPMQGFAP